MDPLYEIALSIKAAHRELDRRVGELMRPLGLTAQQADALYVIARAQPLSLKELGELLIAEAGHPSRLVDRLVDGGFVERIAAVDDRRRIVLSLTPTGRRVVKKIDTKREEFVVFARSLMDAVDVDGTRDFFRELLQHSEYGDLIERRRELEGGNIAGAKRSRKSANAPT